MSINLTTNLSFGTLLTDSEEKQRSGLSRTGHTVVAVFLGIILILGFINNFIVLILFCKFKVLRNPVNMLLLNISISDMLVCLSGTTLSFASSIRGRWIGGYHGCRWYGFANSCFGIVSLISLAILSYERYRTLTLCPRQGADYQKALLAVAGSWLYSLIWTVPPLIGWSSYGTEGAGTSCSVHWTSKSVQSVSYIMCLFIFCLVIPILIMIYFYGRLLYTVKQVGGDSPEGILRLGDESVSVYDEKNGSMGWREEGEFESRKSERTSATVDEKEPAPGECRRKGAEGLLVVGICRRLELLVWSSWSEWRAD
ncbi:opsin-3-like [Antechinus flavipes]|uniref:opsin-3-like n=1 Tax=Antechinus flavipes TaxID=38775 RepID=UPI00223598D4|nr:opsin-3-like [Antechinus flavipes]